MARKAKPVTGWRDPDTDFSDDGNNVMGLLQDHNPPYSKTIGIVYFSGSTWKCAETCRQVCYKVLGWMPMREAMHRLNKQLT